MSHPDVVPKILPTWILLYLYYIISIDILLVSYCWFNHRKKKICIIGNAPKEMILELFARQRVKHDGSSLIQKQLWHLLKDCLQHAHVKTYIMAAKSESSSYATLLTLFDAIYRFYSKILPWLTWFCCHFWPLVLVFCCIICRALAFWHLKCRFSVHPKPWCHRKVKRLTSPCSSKAIINLYAFNLRIATSAYFGNFYIFWY